jgi:transcriptional regulator with XRE-family HTH domain
MIKNTYVGLIKKLRQAKGLSQLDVAKKIDISRTSYIALEQGKRELSLAEAGLLAEILDVALEDLLVGQDTKYKKYEQMLFAFLRSISSDGKITKTKLAKLLYLADFAWFYTHHTSMSGLSYRKIEHGPVPDYFFRLVEELEGDGKISVQPKEKALLISETRSGQKVGDDLLRAEERGIIKKIAGKWKDKDTKEIVDFTHNQLPYTFADKGSIIPYELITQEDPQHVY